MTLSKSNRLPYNLYCVGRDIKHCSLTHYHSQTAIGSVHKHAISHASGNDSRKSVCLSVTMQP